MSYLLDTNVISEWVKPRPNPHVARWLTQVDEEQTYLSVVCFAEIRQGIEDMPPSARRDAITVWLEQTLPARFEGRIIGVDLLIADRCGKLLARGRRMGLNLHVMDAWYAATAAALNLNLVTRNTKHFTGLDLSLLNPWTSSMESA